MKVCNIREAVMEEFDVVKPEKSIEHRIVSFPMSIVLMIISIPCLIVGFLWELFIAGPFRRGSEYGRSVRRYIYEGVGK